VSPSICLGLPFSSYLGGVPAEPQVTPQEFPPGTEIIEITVAWLRALARSYDRLNDRLVRITYRGQ
jgi:hypothetical protein